ncbi:MAG: bifunctional 5,10-methylenetetrahydrofolate dehydrogenase/5,10-methenyltetrahydrofolate cyclohydrolase [Patescibacteria group bacterium]
MIIDAFDKLSINPEANRRIDGKVIAEKIIGELKNRTKPTKFLAAVLVGDPPVGGPATLSFLNQKEKVAKELRVDFRIYRFPETISHDELRKKVLLVAKHKTCGGVIVQLPLPASIRRERVLDVIPPEKDVDVLGKRAYEAFLSGTNPILPPVVGVLNKILITCNLQLSTIKVAVIGAKGFLVGKPISDWLEKKAKELIKIDIGDDINQIREADLVISGVGKSGIIKPEILKDGATVIDFGYSFDQAVTGAKISGDFDSSNQLLVVSKELRYTPVPHGTGPILVAQLFDNFYKLI